MTARIIDGKAIAAEFRNDVRQAFSGHFAMAAHELILRRRLLLEGREAMQDMMRVDGMHRRNIVRNGRAHLHPHRVSGNKPAPRGRGCA